MKVRFRNYEPDTDKHNKWYANTQSVEVDKRCQTIFKFRQNEGTNLEFELHVQVIILFRFKKNKDVSMCKMYNAKI